MSAVYTSCNTCEDGYVCKTHQSIYLDVRHHFTFSTLSIFLDRHCKQNFFLSIVSCADKSHYIVQIKQRILALPLSLKVTQIITLENFLHSSCITVLAFGFCSTRIDPSVVNYQNNGTMSSKQRHL